MWFEQEFVEQIRSSVSILDVAGGYVALKKRGVNHIGLCPFHREKTPSFNVNEGKQIFKCFGCGEGGDVFSFISRIEGLDFSESVEWAAQRAGIALPIGGPSVQETSRRRKFLELMAWADHFFRKQLEQSLTTQEYLKNREISKLTIEAFGVGFAQPGNHLLRELEKAGFSRRDALICGLVKEGKGGELYDNFRNRVMFPIRDLTGATIAFGGRVLGDGIPKYLNSPDTPLYKKSKNLYGLWLSRDSIRHSDFAILVEGYFDCIVPYQFGFTNVVASLGTSLTSDQARMIRRYSSRVVINYDADRAGIAAAMRAVETLIKEDFQINILQLPAEIDPDTFLRDEGSEAYADRLRESKKALDFILAQLLKDQKDLNSPRAKREIVDGILPFLVTIPDKIERSEQISRIASRIQLEPDLLIQEMRRLSGRKRAQSLTLNPPALMRPTASELNLLAMALDPEKQAFLDEFEIDLMQGLVTEPIFVEITELKKRNSKISVLYLRDRLQDPALKDLLESVAIRTSEFAISDEDIRASIQALRRKQVERLIQQIQGQIQKADSAGVECENLTDLLTRKAALRRQLELDLD